MFGSSVRLSVVGLCCVVFPAGLGLLLGCRGNEAPTPQFSPANAAAKALQDFDQNGDQFLDGNELIAAPGLAALLKTGDENSDGKLDRGEITGRIQQFVQDDVAYLPVRFQVFLDGLSLGDAQLKLLPEPCLGEVVDSAEGMTNPEGIVAPQTQRAELGGAQCGLYRIVISKKDAAGTEIVPAHYNQRTTLGIELSLGNREAERMLTLLLSSAEPAE